MTVNRAPVLSVTPKDEAVDEMTVTFKKGEKYELGDTNIVQDSGVSAESGSIEKAFEENTGNDFLTTVSKYSLMKRQRKHSHYSSMVRRIK